jgi:transposase
MKKRESYTKEFKMEAVRMLEEREKTVSEIAMELNVKRTLLYRWRDQAQEKGTHAFLGAGRQKIGDKSAIDQLKQELKEVKEERDILKKAAAYFARELR